MPNHESIATVDDRPIYRDELPAFRERLWASMEKRVEAGLLPYEGRWLPRDEVSALMQAERKKARVRFIELLVLLGLLGLVPLILLSVLKGIAY